MKVDAASNLVTIEGDGVFTTLYPAMWCSAALSSNKQLASLGDSVGKLHRSR